ncbi:16S rRNA (cytidine(1402)-2'-O)-methyltransferase [Aerococcus sanguinicola]|uniref:Ribosomal RNA small subunit methyltransferase I n=1 Tax=Aerococcus sanguinicola TaxID=119206 RepID=A0A0X8FBI4_9LACT|nr:MULTISPECIES: 16S rRNA (cytidine(1402)-2'-O)-methyltransferase [Aerococcus]AMB94200.1 16S rRNA methyltransferase [Aerococcus sanguinicola]MDK7050023.1 16S rRNA (cytidine(1402)-2'-O)-methyltransferase [Aerococcus sanguinicola]OFT92415.1 rRNA (cytidine-2'-O-)-methyltransferase [Aerococcus sp. HMSC23C02]PKZ22376.1 16S rRNA (cytidine(1402)-2'-O)-methyltransferase [Aerococcus sanguinicola]
MQEQKSFQASDRGRLYLVPTPIGNLEDMTFRAVTTLKEADLILSEDTRNTQKLLNHFDISTKQLSYHKFNHQERLATILKRLEEGQVLAQVSDAGMPAISDPGADLVQAVIQAGYAVIPLPGPNAALTALMASGLDTQRFLFVGFPPRKKKALKETLADLKGDQATLIFYESPYRLRQSLKVCAEVFGDDRKVVVVRELTKRFEEFRRGTLAEVLAYYEDHPEIKGEICFMLAGQSEEEAQAEQAAAAPNAGLSLRDQVLGRMAQEGLTSKAAIKAVAKDQGLAKQEVYAAYHQIEGGQG